MTRSLLTLLIVTHSQSGGTRLLADAAVRGAVETAPQVRTTAIPAAQISPAMVKNSDGLIIATPENFGYMAGLIKDFFDRCFYPCETAMAGKPYALIVCAGNDGTGAMNAMERLITGWRMQRIHTGLIARRIGGQVGSAQGTLAEKDISTAYEIGATVAAGLDAGIY
jgi:multimeric flavodoxin WrbA